MAKFRFSASLDIWKEKKAAPVVVASPQGTANRPMQMQFRFLPNGQVIWYSTDTESILRNSFMNNHAVFTIADWVAKKIATVPWILYEVKDETEYKRYKALLKDATAESITAARMVKLKALQEVKNPKIMRIFDKPNPLMTYFEFAYGSYIYKTFVGCSYWQGVRNGSVTDKTIGNISEVYLPTAQHMRIKSGGVGKPIDKFFSITNPELFIDAQNVCQLRNFNPMDSDGTGTEFLYGLSKLYPARKIVQKYNEGTETETDVLQKRGHRHVVFPKNVPDNSEVDYDTLSKTRDEWDRKLGNSEPGKILINNSELGVIEVGFSPKDLGIMESQQVTKEDFCALLNVQPMIFGWGGQTTYTNFPEARKMAITDAILPELEAMSDAFNGWYLPSYDASGRYVIGYDLECFPEMQADMEKTVKWMKAAEAYTTNEIRQATRFGLSKEENADKILVSGGKKLLENIGIESFAGDPALLEADMQEDKDEEDKNKQ